MNLMTSICQSIESIVKAINVKLDLKHASGVLDKIDRISSIYKLQKKEIYFRHPLHSVENEGDFYIFTPFIKVKIEGKNKCEPLWWHAYNEIKHNPKTGLKFATLETLTKSFAAYYLLCLLLNEIKHDYMLHRVKNEEDPNVINRDFLNDEMTDIFMPMFWVDEGDLHNPERDNSLFIIVRPEKRFHSDFTDENFEQILTDMNNFNFEIESMPESISQKPATVKWLSLTLKAYSTLEKHIKWIVKLNDLQNDSPEVIESKRRTDKKFNQS